MGIFSNPLGYVGENVAPVPITAPRAPTTADIGYKVGQTWVDNVAFNAYTLTGFSGGNAQWVNSSAGAGSYATLTVTGASTLGSAGASTQTIGNTTGASGTVMRVGTGNFSLDGVGASTYRIGASTTTGTIGIGGTAQTGDINIGFSSGSQTVRLGSGTGSITVRVGADGGNPNSIVIGSINTTSDTTIRSGSGNVNLAATGGSIVSVSPTTITLGANASTGLAVSTAAGTGVGATFTSSAATKDAIQCVTGSIKVPAPTVAGATPVINNSRTGQASFSDTVNTGVYKILTVTNSLIASGSIILAVASNTDPNTAVIITKIDPGVGSCAFTVLNSGAGNTVGTILINFWILN